MLSTKRLHFTVFLKQELSTVVAYKGGFVRLINRTDYCFSKGRVGVCKYVIYTDGIDARL